MDFKPSARTPRRALPADSAFTGGHARRAATPVRGRIARGGIAATAVGAAVLALATPGLAQDGLVTTEALAPIAPTSAAVTSPAATAAPDLDLRDAAVSRSAVRTPDVATAAEQRAQQLGATASTISKTSDRIVKERKAEAAAKAARAKKLAAEKAAKAKAAAAAKAKAEAARRAASFFWPTKGSITSPWGMRMHPILGYKRMHGGADIGGACNQPIYAVQDGVVTKAASSSQSGNNIRINHGSYKGAKVETAYLHMNRFAVRVGERVERGQVIGTVGSTGLSTACHLHFVTYRNGANVNPAGYLG